jgi:hypothetical protein
VAIYFLVLAIMSVVWCDCISASCCVMRSFACDTSAKYPTWFSRISSSVSTWSLLTVQCWSDSTSALNIFISDINPLLLRSDILIQLLESGKLCVVAYTFILYVSERVTSFFCQTLFKFCEIPDLEAWSDYHFYPFKSQQLSYSSTAGVALLNVLFSQAF